MVQDERRSWRAPNTLAWHEVEELPNGVGDGISSLRARAEDQRNGRRGERSGKPDAALTPQRCSRERGWELCEHAVNRAEGRRCRAQDRDQRRVELRIRPTGLHRYLLLPFGVRRCRAGGGLRTAGS